MVLLLLLKCLSPVYWYPISSLPVNDSIVVLVVLCISVFHGCGKYLGVVYLIVRYNIMVVLSIDLVSWCW